MKSCLVALALAFSFAAKAEPPENCFFGFGTVSPDADPVEVSAGTYEQFLNSLGSRLRPETLRRIVESEDPFTVPEQAETDVATLRSKLAAFKRLLEAKQWNTAPVRAAILARLESRQQNLQQQTNERAQSTRETQSDLKLDLHGFHKPAHTISADGRWFGLLDIPENELVKGGGAKLLILDRLTGKTAEFTNPPAIGVESKRRGRIHLSSNGENLYFFSAANAISVVPLVEGVPQFEKRKLLLRSEVGGLFAMPTVGENPRYVFSDNRTKIQRVNLDTGELVKISIPNAIGDFDIRQVGSLGLSDSVYAVGVSGEMGKIVAVDLNASGQSTKAARTLATWSKSGDLKGMTWTAEGKPITRIGQSFYAWPTEAQPTPFATVDGKAYPGAKEVSVAMHPTGAAVLWRTSSGQSVVEYVDFTDANAPVRAFPLSDGADVIYLSPDGQTLISKHASRVNLIYLKNRL